MNEVLIEIIRSCLSLEKTASGIYDVFSRHPALSDTSGFWAEMHADELRHIRYWENLLELAEDGLIPEVFDKPLDMKKEIETITERVNEIARHPEKVSGSVNAFLLAYQLEFYMASPIFETLFQYGRNLVDGRNPAEEYEDHLTKFIDATRKKQDISPELRFIGEIIMKLWRNNRRLVMQARTDFLTGLLNRRGFLRSVRSMANLAKRQNHFVGIMMVDIDYFKKINDEFGHRDGDRALVRVARTIGKHLRASDLLGRYGGEEFLIYLPDIHPEGLPEIAEKIRAAVQAETTDMRPVTVSIGFTAKKIEGTVMEELETMIREADAFLYEAKESGRNRVKGTVAV